ncbi:MAG: hypothetical protein MUE45_07940 [Methanoregulaceae archaeon]|jgi:hypothetical protein|nr:hypothetical protein [Methanoregulaceae archaeon]
MYARTKESSVLRDVIIAPDVIDYIAKRDCDFRICTSCGGPILLPVRIKPPKKSDLLLQAGSRTIYVSIHQARYLNAIRMDMVPFFDDPELTGHDER